MNLWATESTPVIMPPSLNKDHGEKVQICDNNVGSLFVTAYSETDPVRRRKPSLVTQVHISKMKIMEHRERSSKAYVVFNIELKSNNMRNKQNVNTDKIQQENEWDNNL